MVNFSVKNFKKMSGYDVCRMQFDNKIYATVIDLGGKNGYLINTTSPVFPQVKRAFITEVDSHLSRIRNYRRV